MKKIKNRIVAHLARKGWFDKLSDETYLKLLFPVYAGYGLNLNAPRTFNEKLNWLKLNDRKEIYTVMADKLLAKDFISAMIGEEYVVPVYNSWENVNQIDLNSLPEKFVLKTNHDSGSVQICRDKKTFNFEKAKNSLQLSLNKDYYQHSREWPYKEIKRMVFAEKFLDMGEALIDYKVMCFNGEPKIIQHNYVGSDRHSQDFYDIHWNKLNISQNAYAPVSIEDSPKPEFLEKMINLSRKLSQNTYFLRVDWFISNNKLYSGELTFFDGAGWTPFDDFNTDLELGEMLKLPMEMR